MQIGSKIQIPHGLILAPMAGVTDEPFRLIAKEYGAEYMVSEMLSAKALCYEQLCKRPITEERTKTAPLAKINKEELPMAVQIFGSDPAYMVEAAKMLESGNYRGALGDALPSAIDINMGCPMAKIVNNGEGSALLKNPELAAKIVYEMVKNIHIPVTVKMRIGWTANEINGVEFAKRMEDAGASAICVHGRTREQMYAPSADWNIIKEIKKSVKIPVIGNGDIFTPEDAKRMFDETGVDGIAIGRGAQGNPWIFQNIIYMLEGKEIKDVSICDRILVAKKHLYKLIEFKGEKIGLSEARKHLAWYIFGLRGAADARNKIMHSENLYELENILEGLKQNNLS